MSTDKKIPGLAVVGEWYIADNWYGRRYRVLLTETAEQGFKTKTAANKFAARLKRYAVSRQWDEKAKVFTQCDEHDSFKSFIYHSFGPSLSYEHTNITVAELEKFIADDNKKKQDDKRW